MTRRQHIHGVLLCVTVYLVCLAIAWPFADMGFVDDWSYSKTALVFSRTGHIAYNGWATAMLGWQIPWGALFIRMFGFSFMVMKLSTIPISIATMVLFFGLLARFGVNRWNAVIGTLTLTLSPLFLPLSVSYMTDVPGLLVIVLCIYCCKRAIDATGTSTAIAWMVFASTVSIVGGTVRQLAWLGALIMVPAACWALRARNISLPLFASLGSSALLTVFWLMHWMNIQAYAVPESLLKAAPIDAQRLLILSFYEMFGAVIVVMLAALPVLLAWLVPIRTSKHRVALFFVLLFLALLQIASSYSVPWIPHMYQVEFSTARIAANHTALDHYLLPKTVSLLILLAIGAAAFELSSTVGKRCCERKRVAGTDVLQELFWLCIPFCLAYMAMLLPRARQGQVLDRYALGLVPVAILCVVRLYQDWVSPKLPASSIVLLVVLAVLSVAGTHDWFAWQRARLVAIEELIKVGVPRTSFYGGIEYDGWTQIEHDGYINDERIVNPSGAYKPQPPVSNEDPCGYDFAPYVPSIHAEYTIVFPPLPCLEPTQFPPVTYTSWIPPFRRTIYVQRITAPQRR